MLKWFQFSHAVASKGTEPSRPFFAAHLVDTTTTPIAYVPICDEPGATVLEVDAEPRGFILACCKCLSRSEVRNV